MADRTSLATLVGAPARRTPPAIGGSRSDWYDRQNDVDGLFRHPALGGWGTDIEFIPALPTNKADATGVQVSGWTEDSDLRSWPHECLLSVKVLAFLAGDAAPPDTAERSCTCGSSLVRVLTLS